jgi:hypothetical protein
MPNRNTFELLTEESLAAFLMIATIALVSGPASCGRAVPFLAILDGRLERVEHRGAGNLERAFRLISKALGGLVALQGAADVIFAN